MRLNLTALISLGLATSCGPVAKPAAPAGPAIQVPQDRFVRVNDVMLHYLDWGGSGELLLLLPGLSHTAHSYDGIAPSFTDRYRVMALTRRSHGASEKTAVGIGIDTLAADIVGFLDAVGANRVVLAGHSFAGREMPRVVAKVPGRVAGVIFLDAVYDWAYIQDSISPYAAVMAHYAPPDSALKSIEALESWNQRRFPSHWGLAALNTLRSQTYLQADGRVGWQLPPDHSLLFLKGPLGVDYSAIRVPVLALWANQEEAMASDMKSYGYSTSQVDSARKWVTSYDVRAKRRGIEVLRHAVPNADIVELNTLHTLHWGKPDEVVRLLNGFLNRLPKTK